MQTQSDGTSDALFNDLDPVIRGLGFCTVEVCSARRKGTLHVVLVIHKDDGVDVDDCADVYRAIYPRLEVLHHGVDIQLEVSSPGIYRQFKSPREFEIFAGLGVKVLLEGESEWKKGVINDSADSSVTMDFGGVIEQINFADVRKAKLDYP